MKKSQKTSKKVDNYADRMEERKVRIIDDK